MIILLCLDKSYNLPIEHTVIVGHGLTFFENVYYYWLAQGHHNLPNYDGVVPEAGGWEVKPTEMIYHTGGTDLYTFKLIDQDNVVEIGP